MFLKTWLMCSYVGHPFFATARWVTRIPQKNRQEKKEEKVHITATADTLGFKLSSSCEADTSAALHFTRQPNWNQSRY
ncbi:hypothetical protein BDV32DRAFT_125642, partial [Aspergillus pseudonomiae]